jgi:hypothetical protein
MKMAIRAERGLGRAAHLLVELLERLVGLLREPGELPEHLLDGAAVGLL